MQNIYIKAIGFAWLLLYVIAVFVTSDLDPNSWGVDGRVAFVMCGIGASIIALMITHVIEEDKQYKAKRNECSTYN